ncbi:response regulator transcription factor [Massilia arenosa]|uniref:Response regulator transcription factor n=1 Tax=Zemynaea arenosa TaxID=2561931 RepID=A0A4Y9S6G6_9BURK|nr:response regulator transcription factor [Massilia arenosa]TFW15631.1 response regulator transcription factor [Massilia arenosa]
MRLCLIEDDLELGQALHAALNDAHETVWVRRAADGERLLIAESFDVAILDLGLIDGDGLELLARLRAQELDMPVVVITAREALEVRLRGLNLGADDFLVKPFATSELLARVRAVARRANGWSHGRESVWTVRELTLDEGRMLVRRDQAPLALSPTEFALLRALMRRANRVLTRRQLESWALPNSDAQALDVHMSNLRKKIGGDYIRTIRGVGYVMEK